MSEANGRETTQVMHIDMSDNDLIYPCADCGMLRSKKQGGEIFTVCDKCWNKHYSTNPENYP